MASELPIEISPHALEQMQERGTDRRQVEQAVRQGDQEPARGDRTLFRKNFPFDGKWRGRRYRVKQVAPVVIQESDKLAVVTVYVFYF